MTSLQEATAALRAQAASTGPAMVKARARAYRVEPWQLEMLFGRGASAPFFSPSHLIEAGQALIVRERSLRRLSIVPIGLINAKAVVVLGRWRRRNAKS